ncbi:DUF4357 domain-containing protein [bacterium RCC_150]
MPYSPGTPPEPRDSGSRPSSAGAIVVGRNINGRITWKTADGAASSNWKIRPLNLDI